jgi:hypothetical protein
MSVPFERRLVPAPGRALGRARDAAAPAGMPVPATTPSTPPTTINRSRRRVVHERWAWVLLETLSHLLKACHCVTWTESGPITMKSLEPVADARAGIRKGLAGLGQELPVVRRLAQCEFQDAVGLVVACLAVRDRALDGVEVGAAGPDDELTHAAGLVGDPAGRLGREALDPRLAHG